MLARGERVRERNARYGSIPANELDIAGFSALTDSHGGTAAADLLDNFHDLIHAAADPIGKVHELSGDNAFLVFPEPVMALRAVAALYGMVADQRDLPLVRTGMHHGSALLRVNRYLDRRSALQHVLLRWLPVKRHCVPPR